MATSIESESEIVALVTTRLHDRLPDLAPRQIEDEVETILSSFAGSKVRTFVPVLVERHAFARLRRRSGHDAE